MIIRRQEYNWSLDLQCARVWWLALVPCRALFHGAAPLVQGEPEPPQGPLVRRLQSYRELMHLVAGPWGDLSEDFHKLLGLFAESRAAKQVRANGSQVTYGMLRKLTWEVRRSFSLEIVRLHAKCLLERLQLMAPQAKVAVETRRMVVRRGRRQRPRDGPMILPLWGAGLAGLSSNNLCFVICIICLRSIILLINGTLWI